MYDDDNYDDGFDEATALMHARLHRRSSHLPTVCSLCEHDVVLLTAILIAWYAPYSSSRL